MDAIVMQDTKDETVLFPCCKNVFGGREWPDKSDRSLKPVDIASNMKAVPLGPLYAP